VTLLKKDRPQSYAWKNPTVRMLLFPALVLVAYGILFAIMPDKASIGLKSSGNITLNMLLPLGLVFILMLVLNLFLKPAQIVKFFGREAGVKGVILAAAAGIISAGPIYAWYPLLKDLREKGAAKTFLAIFLGNRAVKPFLLPVMIAYFGWIYVLILTVFTVLGSIVIGYFVGALVKAESILPSRSK
jgi:uncharacterized membrane protein YraQ (UPF0718 family)